MIKSSNRLTEECISGNGALTKVGRYELIDALTCKQVNNEKSYVGLYIRSSNTFLVGMHYNSLIDTHPVEEELGGDGKPIFVATNDLSLHTCMLFVKWMLKRLKSSALKKQEMQSLAWLIYNAVTNAA